MSLIGAGAKRGRLVLAGEASVPVRIIEGGVAVAMVLGDGPVESVDLRLDAGPAVVAVRVAALLALIGVLVVLDDDVAHVAGPSGRAVATVDGVALAGPPVDAEAPGRILFGANIVALVLALRPGKEAGPIRRFGTVAFVHGSSLSRDGIGGLNGFAPAIVVARQISANFLGRVFRVVEEVLDF